MKNIDDFLRDKLEEESSFTNQHKSWNNINKRLDALHIGKLSAKSTLHLWKVATLLSLSAAIWFGLKYRESRKALDQSIDQPTLNIQAPAATDIQPIAQESRDLSAGSVTAIGPKNMEVMEKSELKALNNFEKPANVTREYRANKPNTSTLYNNRQPIAQTHTPSVPEPTAQPANEPTGNPKPPTSTGDLASQVTIEPSVPATASPTQIENEPNTQPNLTQNTESNSSEIATQQTAEPPEQSVNPLPGQPANAVTEQPSLETPNQPVGELPVQSNNAVAEQPAMEAPNQPATEPPAQQTNAVADAPLPAAATTAPMIKPVQKMPALRVGIHGALSVLKDQPEGLGHITSQGAHIEGRVWKNLWATASIDWARQEINTTNNYKKYSLPHPPDSLDNGGPGGGGPGPDPDPDDHSKSAFRKIEGTNKQTLLALGMKYQIPVKFFAQPTVYLAHVWTKTPSSRYFVTYHDEGEHGGGPQNNHPFDFTVPITKEKTTNQNSWSFGLGLETQIKRWNIAFGAYYIKHNNSDNTDSDLLSLRLGLSYALF